MPCSTSERVRDLSPLPLKWVTQRFVPMYASRSKRLLTGVVVPAIHAMQKQPQLEKAFYGNTFTDADKKALLETGNLGRLVELKIPNVPNPIIAFVSVG